MSTRKLKRAIQQLWIQLQQIVKQITKSLVNWLLRGLLVLGRRPFLAQSGFVLPTTVLLLLVLTLTVGAIGYRTFTRTQQVIGERQQRVIFNAATPAVDRAKAKLEFLFDRNRDSRLPAGIPNEYFLLGMLYNDGRTIPTGGGNTLTVPTLRPNGVDPYTFPDEQRLNIGGDGAVDNAWRYRADTNGDGTPDATVAYSLIFTTPGANTGDRPLGDASDAAVTQRATNLQVRHGPLSTSTQTNPNCNFSAAANPQRGWLPDLTRTSILRKNFQIDAYVLPDGANGTVSTLEVHQDRYVELGNRWGAWFRNDLEVFPGPQFNWNGAMHTEGSFILGNNSFNAYMISSPFSCLYSKDAAEMSATKIDENPDEGLPAFQGEFISGKVGDNRFGDSNTIHLWDGPGVAPLSNGQPVTFTDGKDSTTNGGGVGPADYALDPVILQTLDVSKSRGNIPANPRDAAWNGQEFVKRDRMFNQKEDKPFVDDFYRADDRYGPKPRYSGDTIPGAIGQEIGSVAELTNNTPADPNNPEDLGLDGHWERRARWEGLRVVVGQRLQLGDPMGWGGPRRGTLTEVQLREPLRPWRTCPANAGGDCNEARQRVTLWDNLAAVQATAIYHADIDRDFPAACMASVVHPGTAQTLEASSTFEKLNYSAFPFGNAGATSIYEVNGAVGQPNLQLTSDFFWGRGTNGWEFTLPNRADFANLNSPLMQVMQNLANFAGDPNGGSPSFEPVQDNLAHPYPGMAMWGDFSNLRRVIDLMRNGTPYNSLSIADQTTLHTSGCMLGMLAYNIDYLEKFDIGKMLDPAQNPRGLNGAKDFQRLIGFTSEEAEIIANRGLATPVNFDGDANTLADFPSPTTGPAALRQLNAATSPMKAVFNADPTYAVTSILADSPWYGVANLPTGVPVAEQRYRRLMMVGLRGYIRRMNDPATFGNQFVTKGGAGDNQPVPDLNVMVSQVDLTNNPIAYVRLLERWRNNLPASSVQQIDEMNQIIYLAQLIVTKEQVARDRLYGFFGSGNTFGNNVYGEAPLGRCYLWRGNMPIKPGSGSTPATTVTSEPLRELCSARPRYPILYSLFPARDTSAPYAFSLTGASAGGAGNNRDNQAYNSSLILYNNFETHGEEPERARDSEDTNDFYITLSNGGVEYRVVSPAQVALQPKNTTLAGWVVPTATATPAFPTPNSNRNTLVKICTAPCLDYSSGYAPPGTGSPYPQSSFRYVSIPFKDTAPFNGREMMVTRMMDLNLSQMRDATIGNNRWLPNSGIIYAFREDAVSEESIVRRARASWSACNTASGILSSSCRMNTGNVDAYLSTDPPLNDSNKISPKPVDFFPDPDRRPYGFRLRNGKTLNRPNDNGRGLSLVTYNPVYIQGDFNCHIANPTSSCQNDRLEEFNEVLPENFNPNQFYTRRNLNNNFARINSDLWRPSEILADAISIISDNFCDGSIEDTFETAGIGGNAALPIRDSARTEDYGCQGANRTSYLNQDRPSSRPNESSNGFVWARTNPADTMGYDTNPGAPGRRRNAISPVVVNRSGNPMIMVGTNAYGDYGSGNQRFYTFSDGKSLINAQSGTRVNAIIISGLAPSRQNQSYGGLHNFPRFLENWTGSLFISGSFLQLNFSTQATAPFDQDAWEPGDNPGTGEDIRYYDPPDRRWGYDVGLQYAPAGPIARRFASPPKPSRSEFYDEPPSNDPYIRNLCRQISSNCPT